MRHSLSSVDQPAEHQRFEQLLTEGILETAWRHAYRLSATREDAEDLLQRALLRALQQIRQLRDDGLFKAWLLAIIRNLGISDIRRRTLLLRPHPSSMDAGAEVQPPAETADPRVAALATALQALPLGQRTLLQMHYMDGMEATEIAQVLRCSSGALEQRLHRARGALRRALGLSNAEAAAPRARRSSGAAGKSR